MVDMRDDREITDFGDVSHGNACSEVGRKQQRDLHCGRRAVHIF